MVLVCVHVTLNLLQAEITGNLHKVGCLVRGQGRSTRTITWHFRLKDCDLLARMGSGVTHGTTTPVLPFSSEHPEHVKNSPETSQRTRFRPLMRSARLISRLRFSILSRVTERTSRRTSKSAASAASSSDSNARELGANHVRLQDRAAGSSRWGLF